MYACVEENEKDFMDRFWTGLNRDIQDIVMHVEELYYVDHLFHLACKAEQEIRRRVNKTGKRSMESLTLSEIELHGNSNGIDSVSPHEIDLYSYTLDNSCVDLPADLGIQSILENHIDVLNMPSNHTIE